MQLPITPPAISAPPAEKLPNLKVSSLTTRSQNISPQLSQANADARAKQPIAANLVGAQIDFYNNSTTSINGRNSSHLCLNATEQPNIEFGLVTRAASFSIGGRWSAAFGTNLYANAYAAANQTPAHLELRSFSGIFLSGPVGNLRYHLRGVKSRRASLSLYTDLGFENKPHNLAVPKLQLGMSIEFK